MTLEQVQQECSAWIRDTFGEEHLTNKLERAMRVLEEATELAQSLGLNKEDATRVLDQVFAKPVDANIGKEIAGTIVCVMGAATAVNVDATLAYAFERDWRHANQALCRHKHSVKTATALQGNYQPKEVRS